MTVGPHAPTDPMAALVGRLSALDARLKALEVAASAPRSRLRLTATDDVSHTSTAHGLQIGPDSGANLRMDVNEVLATNNGVPATLYIQADAAQPGTLSLGTQAAGGTQVDVDGRALMPAGSNQSNSVSISNGSGWSVTLSQWRQIGPLVYISGTATRTGSAITVPATGDIGNQTVATLSGSPLTTIDGASGAAQALNSLTSGRLARFIFTPSSGEIQLVALAPGADINTNDSFNFGGLVMFHIR